MERLRDEEAGLAVAGSVSMMLWRNRSVYHDQNGVYNLYSATTVIRDASLLVLRFSPNGSGIGHYDIIKVNERVGADRRMGSIARIDLGRSIA